MLGKDEHENKKKPKHTSADDLNDGFILDKDDRRLLSYKDGKMNIEDAQEEQSKGADGQENDQKEEEDESEEEVKMVRAVRTQTRAMAQTATQT